MARGGVRDCKTETQKRLDEGSRGFAGAAGQRCETHLDGDVYGERGRARILGGLALAAFGSRFLLTHGFVTLTPKLSEHFDSCSVGPVDDQRIDFLTFFDFWAICNLNVLVQANSLILANALQNPSRTNQIAFRTKKQNQKTEPDLRRPPRGYAPVPRHNCTHRTITMAAIASINAVARVAAPKVRRLSSRLATRAFSDRAPRQYFRDEPPAKASPACEIPRATPRSETDDIPRSAASEPGHRPPFLPRQGCLRPRARAVSASPSDRAVSRPTHAGC